jgi:PAS domain S-box-containing protein
MLLFHNMIFNNNEDGLLLDSNISNDTLNVYIADVGRYFEKIQEIEEIQEGVDITNNVEDVAVCVRRKFFKTLIYNQSYCEEIFNKNRYVYSPENIHHKLILSDMISSTNSHKQTTVKNLNWIECSNLIYNICLLFYSIFLAFPCLIWEMHKKERTIDNERRCLSQREYELNQFQCNIEEAEQQSQYLQEYISLIDTANAPIFAVDINHNVSEWNQKISTITGITKNEILSTSIYDIIHSPDKSSVHNILLKALHGVNCENYELRILTRENKVCTLSVNAASRRNFEGVIIGVIGVAQDITETKRFKTNENSIRRLIESCDDTVFIEADYNDLWRYISPNFEKVFFPTKIDEVIEKQSIIYVSRFEDEEKLLYNFENKINTIMRLHFRFPGNVNEYHMICTSYHKDDSILYYFRKLTTEDQLDWIMQNTSDVISLHDRKTFRTEEINATGIKLLGYSKEELMSKGMMELIEHTSVKKLKQMIFTFVNNGQECLLPLQILTKHHGYQWMEMNIRMMEGKLICVTRSIEERIRRERAERELILKEEARKKEVELVHFLSHQLKNSLIGAVFMVETLQKLLNSNSPIDVINTQIGNLINHLVNAKHIVLHETAIRSILCDEYYLDFQQTNSSKLIETLFRNRINVTNHINEITQIAVDPLPLEHIVSNILDNAFKYGGHPYNATLKMHHRRYQFDQYIKNVIYDFTIPENNATEYVWLEIEVSNGINQFSEKLRHMSKYDLHIFFDKGKRLGGELGDIGNNDKKNDNTSHLDTNDAKNEDSDKDGISSNSSRGHGTWIIQKCLMVMKGLLEFYVCDDLIYSKIYVPVKYIEIDSAFIPSLPEGIKIAILDDSEIIRKMVSNILLTKLPTLKRNGNCHVFGKTINEIETFSNWVLKNTPDVIILDENLDYPDREDDKYGLPFMKGTSIIKTMREQKCDAVIIICSANNTKEDINIYIQSGADGFMSKDYMATRMVDVIKQLCHNHYSVDWYKNKNKNKNDLVDTKISLSFLTEGTISYSDIIAELTRNEVDLVNCSFEWNMIHKVKGNIMVLTNEIDEAADLVNKCESLRGVVPITPDDQQTLLDLIRTLRNKLETLKHLL